MREIEEEGITGKQMIPVEFTKLLRKSGKGRGRERKLFMKLFPLTDYRICYIQRA